MNYHKNNSGLFLFIFIFIYLSLEIESFAPTGRLDHSSVLVGSKLYFFGGKKDDGLCSNEVFYLDISQSFNTQEPPWYEMLNYAIPFKSCLGTASLSNDGKTIYLFGGDTYDLDTNKDKFVSIIYSLHLNT